MTHAELKERDELRAKAYHMDLSNAVSAIAKAQSYSLPLCPEWLERECDKLSKMIDDMKEVSA